MIVPMRKNEVDEGGIMRRLAAGDHEALRDLYRKYSGLVYGIALRILKDPAVAEEAAQDAFVNAWRGAASYGRERGAVATWLGRIARNKAIDLLRSARARGSDEVDEWAEAAEIGDDRGLDPFESMHRDLRAAALRRAVAELPEAERRALALAFFQGMSHSEIAAKLELPLGTVKSRIREAMLKLRARLGDEADD